MTHRSQNWTSRHRESTSGSLRKTHARDQVAAQPMTIKGKLSPPQPWAERPKKEYRDVPLEIAPRLTQRVLIRRVSSIIELRSSARSSLTGASLVRALYGPCTAPRLSDAFPRARRIQSTNFRDLARRSDAPPQRHGHQLPRGLRSAHHRRSSWPSKHINTQEPPVTDQHIAQMRIDIDDPITIIIQTLRVVVSR